MGFSPNSIQSNQFPQIHQNHSADSRFDHHDAVDDIGAGYQALVVGEDDKLAFDAEILDNLGFGTNLDLILQRFFLSKKMQLGSILEQTHFHTKTDSVFFDLG